MGRSEKEKMLAGELYLGNDPELVLMRRRTREILLEYNLQMAAPVESRLILLKTLLGRCAFAEIQPPFYCDYGNFIFAGHNLYMNFNCIILDCAPVTIGNNVMFGPYVQVYTAHHPVLAAERIRGPELASPVNIGDNVWVGGGAIICPGITIGPDTTIGAGAVVTRDIPAGVFAAGNPCRVIRQLQNPTGSSL